MNTTLAAELFMLSNWLARIAGGNRFTRDFTRAACARRLPRLRRASRLSLLRQRRGVSDTDRKWIDWAVKAAKRREPHRDPTCSIRARRAHAGRGPPPKGPRRQEMLRFAMRPAVHRAVVAKGVEDTAFYRYNRFIA